MQLRDSSLTSDVSEPDHVARPVLVVDICLVTGFETRVHAHRKAELLFTARGAVTCEASKGLWIVPPQSAVWIPGGTPHNVKGVGALQGYCLFVEPDVATALPSECCAVAVSPLLRELLVRAASLPALYPVGGAEARLVTVLLDELAAARVEDLHFPMPTDARLRRLAERMMGDPSDRSTMAMWAKRIGVGERTLNRLLVRETGMSFGRWRQQLHILLSLQWLSRGASVQEVATDLGYESASSFVTMFRKALGASPARYMSLRLENGRALEG